MEIPHHLSPVSHSGRLSGLMSIHHISPCMGILQQNLLELGAGF